MSFSQANTGPGASAVSAAADWRGVALWLLLAAWFSLSCAGLWWLELQAAPNGAFCITPSPIPPNP